MVITHTSTGFRQHFHLSIIRNMDLETVSQLGTQIIDKSQKAPQNDSQETPQMNPKTIKVNSWTPMCPLGVPLDPWITKVVPRVPKMKPQGLQNYRFGYKK